MKRSIAVLSFLSSLCVSISALAQWTLDGRDQAGQLLPSGVYFCRVSAGADRATQKILLMR